MATAHNLSPRGNLGPDSQSIAAPQSSPVRSRPQPKPPAISNVSWPLYSLYPPGPEWPYSAHVPVSQNPSHGYDVRVTRLSKARRQAALGKVNGQIQDGPNGYRLPLFIQGTSLDTSLSGSYAQSQYTRDFYPRNFVQPSIAVVGQSLTQEDYGILCEFIHSCQHKAVANGFANLTQLFVIGRNDSSGLSGRGVDGHRQQGTRVMLDKPNQLMGGSKSVPGRSSDPSSAPSGTYYSQSIRGAHQSIAAKGYISSMPRIHRKFEYAVQWTFVFTIAAMIHGPFNDTAQPLPGSAPTTWLDMLNDIKKSGVISNETPGLIAFNKKVVRAASKAFINPLTPAPPSGSTGQPPGGGGPAPSGVNVPGISNNDAVAAINSAITTYHVPSGIFYGMFDLETALGSGINTSTAGAVGPFQFTGANNGPVPYPMTNTPNLSQFQQQAKAAAAYLAQLRQQTGSWHGALAAYNAGIANQGAGQGYADQAISWAQSHNLPVN